jgi:RNA polymerase sigma factor (TIGR02999 family)
VVVFFNQIPHGDNLRSVSFAGLTPIDRHAERERLPKGFLGQLARNSRTVYGYAFVRPRSGLGVKRFRTRNTADTLRIGPEAEVLGVGDVTQILQLIDQGHNTAADSLLPIVYGELRKLAAHRLAMEKPGQTLTPTGLVHEAYLRLVDVERVQLFNGRGHFFAAAAEAMRRILIESARRKQTKKRSAGRADFDPDTVEWQAESSPEELLAIDDVLDRLAAEDVAAAELVKMRVFAGFSIEEAATLLGISRTSAYRTWKFARAWLSTEIHH